jgi:hypothetical protein
MTEDKPITGSIHAVRDCGTVVLVLLDADDGRTVLLVLDRSALTQQMEGGDRLPDQVVGRRIRYDGRCIEFLDGECPA